MTDNFNTLHPFAFEKEGKFSTPHVDYVISVHAAEKLLAHVPRSAKEEKALSVFKTAVGSLKTEIMYSPTLTNDAPEGVRKKAFYQYNTTCFGYHSTNKLCFVAVQPNTFQDIFDPNHQLVNDVSINPNSWGWEEVLSLRPHKKVLEDLCAELEISFNTTLLQRTANIKNLMEKGTVKVRVPNSVADMGRACGFVVYSNNGYIDPKFNTSTIEKAWVFGSERLAQMAINRYGWNDGIIVEVEVSLKRVLGAAPDGQLNEALASLQKERLKEALEHMEIDALRERLAQLEGNIEMPETPAKRKM